MSKLVMGYWDCPVCGAKEIRGDVTNCPSCGRARGDVQFYVKGYQEGQNLREEELSHFEQLDDEKAQTFSKNPDWYCSFCNSLNSDNAKFCNNCGSSREDSEANYFEMLQKKKEREAAEAAAQPQPSSAQAKPSRSPMKILLLILLAVIALFIWMNGNKTSGDLTVTGLQWVRNINIEENRMYQESDWSLPAGAEQTDARSELHHYDKVFDHYESVQVPYTEQVYDHDEYTLVDNGNGTFSEVSHPVYRTETRYKTEQQAVYVPVPRYQTKYYYNIWRWTPSRDVTASGDDHNAVWPEVELGENEREGQRTEAYAFTVEHIGGKEAPATYRIAESDWMNINVNDKLYITSKRTGALPFISDEKGNKIADIVQVK
ncbi:MAG: hypothetical protein J5841_06865 [Clostridia bacterium]|nr:hypothetical protein [Clostridia bacterium]